MQVEPFRLADTTPGPTVTIPDWGGRYLELLKFTLTRGEDERLARVPPNHSTPWKRARTFAYEQVNRVLGRAGLALVATHMGHRETMTDPISLTNIQECVRSVVREGVPGDLVETGVWRGGSAIFMRACLEVYGDTSRKVWAADSFKGLPPPSPQYAADAGDTQYKESLGVGGVETVRHNFEKYGLLDDRVRFLVGWFKDTIPTAPIERVAVLRLDGDMYESTIQVLEALEPKVSPGGYVIVDDYLARAGCKKAVDDYRRWKQINAPLERVDWTVHFWRK